MAERLSAAIGWRLADVLRGEKAEPLRQDGMATFVRRDDDGTAWIRIPGNDFDTPVEGGMYADAQEGDAVPYSIAGGQVAVTGNVTSPSVGQRVVDATIAPVRAAVSRAAESIVMVRSIADAAKRVADAIDQHFWADTNGIHVTHATQEDWTANQSGPNVLINSVGQLFRDGLNNLVAITTEQGARAISFFDGAGNAAANVLAVIGADGITLGRSTESHAYVDYHSLQMVDSGGNTYFHVSDLRDASGLYETVDTFVGNGAKILFPLSFKASSHDYTVKVDGVEVTSGIAKGLYQVDFTTAPSDGAVVTVEYATTSERAKAYTLGFRASGSKVGAMSLAEGLNVTASGEFSHAEGGSTQSTNSHCHAEGASTVASGLDAHSEGIYTVASGSYSHAQNDHTIAAKLSQTALGTYNVEDAATTTTHPDGFRDHGAYALIIGNGTDDEHRSNALTVDWQGNVDAAGRITQAVDSTTATVGAASASIGTNSIRRAGNVVTVTLSNIQLASAIANNSYSGTIATIPSAYRPAANVYGVAFAAGANLGGSYARITTAGVVAIRNQSGSSIAASSSVLLGTTITYVIS